jgi:hypothetical protein
LNHDKKFLGKIKMRHKNGFNNAFLLKKLQKKLNITETSSILYSIVPIIRKSNIQTTALHNQFQVGAKKN